MDKDTKIGTKLIWVYKTVQFGNTSELAEWNLSPHGIDGWELVQVVLFGSIDYPAGTVIFKRQELVAV